MMKEHTTQWNSATHWCVFNSFWTTVKLYIIEELDILGFEYLLER